MNERHIRNRHKWATLYLLGFPFRQIAIKEGLAGPTVNNAVRRVLRTEQDLERVNKNTTIDINSDFYDNCAIHYPHTYSSGMSPRQAAAYIIRMLGFAVEEVYEQPISRFNTGPDTNSQEDSDWIYKHLKTGTKEEFMAHGATEMEANNIIRLNQTKRPKVEPIGLPKNYTKEDNDAAMQEMVARAQERRGDTPQASPVIDPNNQAAIFANDPVILEMARKANKPLITEDTE